LQGDASGDRLNVIVGSRMTLRHMARLLLSLWTTATPAPPGQTTTPPTAAAAINEDGLARALFVYNRYYLQGESMTRWRTGLRFPLPVRIDAATNEGVLHPLDVESLAAAFDAAWEPLLDQQATPPDAAAPSDLRQSVATFLTTITAADARAIALSSRALTNALESRAFILEAFDQLGTGAFDVALEFVRWTPGERLPLLASQRAGADIIARVRAALAAPPASLSPDLSAGLARANQRLDALAGVAAREPNERALTPREIGAGLVEAIRQGRLWVQDRDRLHFEQLARTGEVRAGGGTTVPSPELLRLLDALLRQTRANPTPPARPDFGILSMIRFNEGPHGEVQPGGTAVGRAVDISRFGGHQINISNPDEALAGVLAVIATLPTGCYTLGLPRPSIPVNPALRNPFLPVNSEADIAHSPTGSLRGDLSRIQDAESRRQLTAAMDEARAQRGVRIQFLYPDALDHLHVKAVAPCP
jgi:hypothetical protein